jgi:hypothetical protein
MRVRLEENEYIHPTSTVPSAAGCSWGKVEYGLAEAIKREGFLSMEGSGLIFSDHGSTRVVGANLISIAGAKTGTTAKVKSG